MWIVAFGGLFGYVTYFEAHLTITCTITGHDIHIDANLHIVKGGTSFAISSLNICTGGAVGARHYNQLSLHFDLGIPSNGIHSLVDFGEPSQSLGRLLFGSFVFPHELASSLHSSAEALAQIP